MAHEIEIRSDKQVVQDKSEQNIDKSQEVFGSVSELKDAVKAMTDVKGQASEALPCLLLEDSKKGLTGEAKPSDGVKPALEPQDGDKTIVLPPEK